MAVDLEPKPVTTTDQLAASARTDRRFGTLIVVLIALAGLAFGLLLLLTTGESDEPGAPTATNEVTGLVEPQSDLTVLSQPEVMDILYRTDETPDMVLEVLYTPTWYYDWSDRPEPDVDQDSLVFMVFETIHAGELPDELPDVTLSVSEGGVAPHFSEIVTDSSHHRVTRVYLPALDAAGEPAFPTAFGSMQLKVHSDEMTSSFAWPMPLDHGLGVIEAPVEVPGADPGIETDEGDDDGGLFGSGTLTMGAIAAIFAGMMTALSPCLLFLAVYYSAVLSGVTVSDEAATTKAKRKLYTTAAPAAASFVGGLTEIYTVGGIGAGFIGASLSRLNLVDTWARPVSIIAGVVVVYMGIRTAAQANVPMVCKIPVVNRKPREGRFGPLVMGSTFAVGCLSCFSATVLSALLLYAGATGSPMTGGLIMLIFSLSVGALFLIAAWLLANAAPLMTWLEKARPWIGGFSAVVMIGFGLLMITYKFHIWTGALFRLWS